MRATRARSTRDRPDSRFRFRVIGASAGPLLLRAPGPRLFDGPREASEGSGGSTTRSGCSASASRSTTARSRGPFEQPTTADVGISAGERSSNNTHATRWPSVRDQDPSLTPARRTAAALAGSRLAIVGPWGHRVSIWTPRAHGAGACSRAAACLPAPRATRLRAALDPRGRNERARVDMRSAPPWTAGGWPQLTQRSRAAAV